MTLGHLDQLRQTCRQYDLFNLRSIQQALQTVRGCCTDNQKKKFSDLFALADSESEDEEQQQKPRSKSFFVFFIYFSFFFYYIMFIFFLLFILGPSRPSRRSSRRGNPSLKWAEEEEEEVLW